MARRPLRYLVLVLALLAGQWAGILHAAGHHSMDGDAPHAACELCAVQGMWDHGMAVAIAAAPRVAPVSGTRAAPYQGRRHAVLPPFRSRAPPVLV